METTSVIVLAGTLYYSQRKEMRIRALKLKKLSYYNNLRIVRTLSAIVPYNFNKSNLLVF